MKEIIDKVAAAFTAKRLHGPNSEEFKSAQLSAMEEINNACACNDDIRIPTHSKNDMGQEVFIRVQKRGEGAIYCSYVLEAAVEIQEGGKSEKVKRHPWPHVN